MCDRVRRKTDAKLSVSNEHVSCRFGCIIEPTGFIMNKHTYEDDVPERLKELEENVWCVGLLEINWNVLGEAVQDIGKTGWLQSSLGYGIKQ